MKILQVIPSVHPCYGGTSEVFLQICRAIQALGAKVEVATTDASGPGRDPIPEPYRTEFTSHVFAKSFSEGWKYSLSFRGWMKRNAGRFDLVHGHSVWSYLPSASAAICSRDRIPFFLSPHGMLSPYTFSRNTSIKKLFWTLSEKKMVTSARGFFASSEEEAGEIRKIRKDAQILVLPHGLPDEAVTTPRQPMFLRYTFGINDNIPILLFFSRLHPKKGLQDLLLPAISQLKKQVHLFVAGGEDPHCPGFESQIRQQIEMLGLSGKVTLLGPIQAKEKWKYFDSADLFVLPSFAENFGMVVVESMARGVPVLISDQVQAGEIIKKHQGGLVLPRVPQIWTTAIENALGNSPLTRPSYFHTWRSVGIEMLNFYNLLKVAS